MTSKLIFQNWATYLYAQLVTIEIGCFIRHLLINVSCACKLPNRVIKPLFDQDSKTAISGADLKGGLTHGINLLGGGV